MASSSLVRFEPLGETTKNRTNLHLVFPSLENSPEPFVWFSRLLYAFGHSKAPDREVAQISARHFAILSENLLWVGEINHRYRDLYRV